MPKSALPRALSGALLVLAIAACHDPLALPPATFENTVDTTTIYALRGTALTLPSGFDVVNGGVARTDRAEPFDFAFDIADDGRPLIYPAKVIGVGTDAGVQVSTESFDAITTAPTEGFQNDSAVTATVGKVLLVRSRFTNQACALLGSLPRYGKMRVLAVNDSTRTITLETLIDTNCGYRNLEPGIPEN